MEIHTCKKYPYIVTENKDDIQIIFLMITIYNTVINTKKTFLTLRSFRKTVTVTSFTMKV